MIRYRLILLVLVFLWSECSVFAQHTDTLHWTPALQMRYRSISEVVLSPSGTYVAFVVREPRMKGEESRYVSHIWVAHLKEGWTRQFTQGKESCTQPAFSPDEHYLTFLSTRGGEKRQVWIMPLRGGEARQLTRVEASITTYRWAPDGERIAFLMTDPETPEEKQRKKEKRDAYVMDSDFHYAHLYTTTVPFEQPEEAQVQRLTRGAFHITDFDWSPDSRMLVFSHQADPRVNTGFIEQDISTVPADSGAVAPLVIRPGVDTTPRFSPDGRWVAFVSHGGRPEPVGLRDVYVIHPTGGSPRRLALTPDRNAQLVDWSADSKQIFVREALRTSRHVLAVPLKGDSVFQITPGEGVYGTPSFDRNTRHMALTYEDLDQPIEVYVAALERPMMLEQVSHINDRVVHPPLAKTEKITWTSPDGRQIEGLLTYPVAYTPGKRYPLVLNIHGGPAGVYTRTFTGRPSIYMLQTFAQEGFAILRPNPRGSTGYGKEFRYANVRDWGYGDYEDVMSGVDKVIEMGIAHPDSLTVMGWSYGGYLTSFTVTRTDRFKAASMGAGLPNLISMVTTTDIPDYLVAHMGAEFWEDYDTYEKHSAIYRVAQVTTPTQVLHGEQDWRVPFTQGKEFYVALQRRGVPTEMVVYPRTPHGPREPKLLMDVTPRILSWFNRHLHRK